MEASAGPTNTFDGQGSRRLRNGMPSRCFGPSAGRAGYGESARSRLGRSKYGGSSQTNCSTLPGVHQDRHGLTPSAQRTARHAEQLIARFSVVGAVIAGSSSSPARRRGKGTLIRRVLPVPTLCCRCLPPPPRRPTRPRDASTSSHRGEFERRIERGDSWSGLDSPELYGTPARRGRPLAAVQRDLGDRTRGAERC